MVKGHERMWAVELENPAEQYNRCDEASKVWKIFWGNKGGRTRPIREMVAIVCTERQIQRMIWLVGKLIKIWWFIIIKGLKTIKVTR